MTTHPTCCEAAPPSGLARGLFRGVLPAAVLLALPKCPMCLAAYIAATGIGVTVTAAFYLRTALLALCAVTLAHLALQLLRRRVNKSASDRTG